MVIYLTLMINKLYGVCTVDNRPSTDKLHQFLYFFFLSAYCLFPTAYRLLPTAYCLLPTAYCLMPNAKVSPCNVGSSVSQSPAWTNMQSPVQVLHIALLITCTVG